MCLHGEAAARQAIFPCAAEIEAGVELHLHVVLAGAVDDADALGADHGAGLVAQRKRARLAHHAFQRPALAADGASAREFAAQHIVGAQKIRCIESRGLRIDLDGRAGLDDDAALQQQHMIRHGQSLGLIMGHHDGADAQFQNQLADPVAGVLAQLGVEVGQGLVHQQHARLIDQRAADGDALLLTARELVRKALGQMAQSQLFEDRHDAHSRLLPHHAAQLEAIGDIVEDIAMGPQGVGLEHEADVALLGRQSDPLLRVQHHISADLDAAALWLFQAGDAAQQRGLAAA